MNSTTEGVTEDRTDTKRALVMHRPDGELYITEYCSLWRGDFCVGTRMIAVAGPIARRDITDDGGELVPSSELFDRIDAWEDLSPEDTEWLQAEEEAGRVDYPLGAR